MRSRASRAGVGLSKLHGLVGLERILRSDPERSRILYDLVVRALRMPH